MKVDVKKQLTPLKSERMFFEEMPEGKFFWFDTDLFLKPRMGNRTGEIMDLELDIAINLTENILVVFDPRDLVTPELKSLEIVAYKE